MATSARLSNPCRLAFDSTVKLRKEAAAQGFEPEVWVCSLQCYDSGLVSAENVDAVVNRSTWKPQPIFDLIQADALEGRGVLVGASARRGPGDLAVRARQPRIAGVLGSVSLQNGDFFDHLTATGNISVTLTLALITFVIGMLFVKDTLGTSLHAKD